MRPLQILVKQLCWGVGKSAVTPPGFMVSFGPLFGYNLRVMTKNHSSRLAAMKVARLDSSFTRKIATFVLIKLPFHVLFFPKREKEISCCVFVGGSLNYRV